MNSSQDTHCVHPNCIAHAAHYHWLDYRKIPDSCPQRVREIRKVFHMHTQPTGSRSRGKCVRETRLRAQACPLSSVGLSRPALSNKTSQSLEQGLTRTVPALRPYSIRMRHVLAQAPVSVSLRNNTTSNGINREERAIPGMVILILLSLMRR